MIEHVWQNFMLEMKNHSEHSDEVDGLKKYINDNQFDLYCSFSVQLFEE